MATSFITPTLPPMHRNTKQALPLSRPKTPLCSSTSAAKTATTGTSKSTHNITLSNSKLSSQCRRTSALVIDSLVRNATEAHHWITVGSAHTRMFERAASAQASMTRVVESRTGTGASSRWVLRETPDPCLGLDATACFENGVGKYVVMESFEKAASLQSEDLTKRWLAAVKRLGRMFDTVDIKSIEYDNVFTAKMHRQGDLTEDTVVRMQSFTAEPGMLDATIDVLKSSAESAVANRQVLKFCVLKGGDSLVKTVAVFGNGDAMKSYLDGSNKVLAKRLRGKINSTRKNSNTFQPIIVT